MRLYTLIPLFVAIVSKIPAALAWGAAGHEIVATIAQIHLHPTAFSSICYVLNYTSPTYPDTPLCHLAPVAAWADRVRFKMRWSAGLHYIGALDDWPRKQCVFPGDRGWSGREGNNVLGAVRNLTTILQEWVTGDVDDGMANEALKFLVHFMGDMHQPLHLTGRQRGGNSVKVSFDGRATNLHSLWDNVLVAKAIRTIPTKYSHPLPSLQIEYALRGTIYDSYVRRVMWEGILGKWKDDVAQWLACPTPLTPPQIETQTAWQAMLSFLVPGRRKDGSAGGPEMWDDTAVCPFAWAEPIHRLNCDLVWPPSTDEPSHGQHAQATPGDQVELDTPEYAGAIADAWVVEELMAKAGVRLAAVLNYLFADWEEEGGLIRHVA